MIVKLFIATGVAFWALVILAMGLSLLRRGRVRRVLEGPALFPYTFWTRYRLAGAMLAFFRRRKWI